MNHPCDARPTHRAAARWAAAAASASLALFAAAGPAAAQPSQDVDSLRDVAVDDLADVLAGTGVTITSALFAGDEVQAGQYRDMAIGAISPASGVVLSSGSVIHADPASEQDVDFTSSAVLGPNTKLTTSGDLGTAGSPLLEELFGSTTYDAAVLTLEVVPEGDELTLGYVFGSEEHAVWAEREFGDAFAIVVDGTLCSTVPDSDEAVSTASIGADSEHFVVNYSGNDPSAGEHHTEMNGFTRPLTCVAEVTPGVPSTVVVAVADTIDGQLDSSVLLEAGSLSSVPIVVEPTPTPTPTPDPTPTPTPDPSPTPTPTPDPTPTPTPDPSPTPTPTPDPTPTPTPDPS
ncbi:MAG: choice-of-anchor L domain-containing protein, partial [Cellulomonadaceae bacterium]